jgi:membrane protease YdiL (CAAX protease family)
MRTRTQKWDSITTLTLFFILVVAFYFVGYWLIYRFERATPLMLSVGVAAIATCVIRKRSLSTLGWSWGDWKYQWMSYLIPLGIIFVAYLTIWLLGLGDWYNTEFVESQKNQYNLSGWSDYRLIFFHFVISAIISFALLLPSVLGEEIAWRGLLVPELTKFMSFTGVSLTSGLIWSIWHWPLIIMGIYGNGVTHVYYQLLCFTVFITSISFVMTYLRLKTNSLWTAVVFHMSINVFSQKVFEPLTGKRLNSEWFLGDTGVVLAIVSLIVAFYFWGKGRREFAWVEKSNLT